LIRMGQRHHSGSVRPDPSDRFTYENTYTQTKEKASPLNPPNTTKTHTGIYAEGKLCVVKALSRVE